MYCGVYNICISKMHTNNSIKAMGTEMEDCCFKVLILYMKGVISLDDKLGYIKDCVVRVNSSRLG